MTSKNHIHILICGIALTFCACSLRTPPAISSGQTILTIQYPEQLLPETNIDLSLFQVKPVSCYEPELIIKDSFSSIEKIMVGIKDKDFFTRHPDFTINMKAVGKDEFRFPLANARLLSQYGRRNGRMHYGMDLKVNRRDTIVAAFDGIVRMTGRAQGYGNVVVIRHYNGLETIYAHNSKHFVRSGMQIKAGTPIGLTGSTGRSTTDHLHFEIRINGTPIDPRQIIDFEQESLLPQCLVFTLDKKGKIRIETI